MKFLYLNKSQGYILATLLCLVFLGSCYFFIYVPANEKKIEEQRFRTLQNVDRNIHDKMDNSVSLIKNLLKAYDGQTETTQYLKDYIADYPSDKFTLTSNISSILSGGKRVDDSLRDAENIVVNNSTRQISITLSKPNPANTGFFQISLNYSFVQFISSLIDNPVFDEYIVISNNNIVYESFPTGIGKVIEDSLLNSKNGINGSYVKDMTAGGKEYKIFSQTVTFDSTHRWILGGLLSKHQYMKERSQLPSSLLLLMVTIVVGIVVIFPWIKLYQMGSKDRLTLTDGTSSIVVAMLLMSLMFFCFFKYNDYVRNNNISISKHILDTSISGHFYNETIQHYNILKSYDSLKKQYSLGSIVNLLQHGIRFDNSVVNTETSGSAQTDLNKLKTLLNQYKDSADIKQVFWMDSLGKEKFNWTKDKRNAPHNNFSNRNYFKNIVGNNPYYLQGDTTKKYFLDQVVSRTTGVFTSVISMPSTTGKSNVVAMSFTMRSVQDVMMPTGFSYAIIDNRGKVLYHSITSRNLNENIQNELSDSATVADCINTHSAAEFPAIYYGKSYYVRVSPMKNLPYLMVILSDSSYSDTRDIEIYSFTFSLLVLIFLFMMVQLFITFLVSSRRSFFKKQSFDTSWIGPKISFHREYILSSATNLIIIFLLVVCFKKFTLFQYIFLLLFSVTLVALFQNILFAKRYKKEGNKVNLKYKQRAVQMLSILLVVINLTAYSLLGFWHFAEIVFVELIIAIAGFGINWFSKKLTHDLRNKISPKLNYINSFALMAISCLVITSGLPVAFFYKSSYNFEQYLGIRYRQNDYAKRLMEQPNAVRYYDRTLLSMLPDTVSRKEVINSAGKYDTETKRMDRVFSAFHLAIGENVGREKTKHYFETYAADSSIVYKPAKSSGDKFVYAYKQIANSDKYLKLTSENTTYDILGPQRGWLPFAYWLFLVAGLIIFYFVIVNIVKKIFCLNLPDLEIWKELDDKILTDNNLNKFLLVIGLPGASKFKYILDQVKLQKIKWNDQQLIYDESDANVSNVYVADLLNIPRTAEMEKDEDWKNLKAEVIKPKYKMVIINHFEYNMQDEVANIAKLQLIEELMVKSKCKIIILSTIHPLSFLDSLNSGTLDKSIQDIDRWHVLMGHFRISIMPITKQFSEYKPSWHQILFSETEYTHFLQDMQQVAVGIAKGVQENEAVEKADQLAYKLQVTSQYFYMYIWQSLTKEEKFLLYDLAEDNLVNSYDDYNLTMLIAKGVIIQSNGLLRLFNRGFRNFILTAIGNSEVLKIKERIRESGNWNNLKTPLVLIILSILAFLLISQQEAYSRLLTYIAALSAGVPAVLKIFSLFDKNSAKTNG